MVIFILPNSWHGGKTVPELNTVELIRNPLSKKLDLFKRISENIKRTKKLILTNDLI